MSWNMQGTWDPTRLLSQSSISTCEFRSQYHCHPSKSSLSLDKHSAVQEFPTVFDGNIDSMEGEKFHIYLTDDAKPFCVNTPIYPVRLP